MLGAGGEGEKHPEGTQRRSDRARRGEETGSQGRGHAGAALSENDKARQTHGNVFS